MTLAKPVNFTQWIEENRHLLKPPVGNKTMAVGDDFIVMIVGGPNARTDFHVDPYEEWFYQLTGNMHVNVIVDGKEAARRHPRGRDLAAAWQHAALAAAPRGGLGRPCHRARPRGRHPGAVPVVLP